MKGDPRADFYSDCRSMLITFEDEDKQGKVGYNHPDVYSWYADRYVFSKHLIGLMYMPCVGNKSGIIRLAEDVYDKETRRTGLFRKREIVEYVLRDRLAYMVVVNNGKLVYVKKYTGRKVDDCNAYPD